MLLIIEGNTIIYNIIIYNRVEHKKKQQFYDTITNKIKHIDLRGNYSYFIYIFQLRLRMIYYN